MIALLLAATSAVCSPCVIQNVRVEVGNGTTLAVATVTLDHGRITAISPGNTAPAAPGATVIDGKGKTLAPGFIAPESDVGLAEVMLEPSSVDVRVKDEPMRPGFSVAWGFNPETIQIPIIRDEGLTSQVIVPVEGVLAGQAFWVDLTGSMDSVPDPAKPTAMIGDITSGAAGSVGGARGELWLRLRQAFEDARFFKTNRAAYEQGRARPLSLSPLHLQALLPVISGELPLVLEAHRASDIAEAIAFAQAEHVKLIISGGTEAWKVADRLAKAQVPVIIEPSTQSPADFDQLGARDDLPALLEQAHVPWLITVWSFPEQIRRLRQEAGIAVSYGASHGAALQAITLAVAKAYGRAKDYGSIEVGKRADVVLWSGDPLELSSVAEHVWIGGVDQPLRTRERDLAERYR